MFAYKILFPILSYPTDRYPPFKEERSSNYINDVPKSNGAAFCLALTHLAILPYKEVSRSTVFGHRGTPPVTYLR